MGLRYRKSINLGAGFRVNISKSGIGYSWGCKGYRKTHTADGKIRQTVSIPGSGLSYVDEYNPNAKKKLKKDAVSVDDLYETENTMDSIDLKSTRSCEYEDLYAQIKTVKTLNVVLIIALLLALAYVKILCVIPIAGLVLIHTKYRCRIEYSFEPGEAEKWEAKRSAWKAAMESDKLYRVLQTSTSKNKRITAGIENAVATETAKCSGKTPWYLKVDVDPVVVSAKEYKFVILPDRMLVIGKKGLSAIPYETIEYAVGTVDYLEAAGSVPKDSYVSKTVWKYANEDGTPDKRYSGNEEMRLFKYGVLEMKTKDGLDIRLLFSNWKAAESLEAVLK